MAAVCIALELFSRSGTMAYQKIKVAMYTPFFFPVLGGTENATYHLTKALQGMCDVKICTFNWTKTSHEDRKYGFNLSSGLPEEETIGEVRVSRYPITNLPVVMNFSKRLINDLSSSDIDVLHFQGLHRLLNRWLLQKTARKKIKILTTHALHESIDIVQESRFNLFVNRFFIDSLKNVDHIIALSDSDQKALASLGLPRNKITVIPNGIDPEKFNSRQHFVERNEKMKILCVARFDKNKNYESLVYALNKLKSYGLAFDAYFVGSISDREYFEKVIALIKRLKLEDSIKIGVSLSDPALIDCYLSCDIFVLPSTMETFPIAILEAMYAGLPVVATHVGGIPDIIKDGINGFLVPPNNPQKLYERCLRLLKDAELRNDMAKANKEIAKNYTWTNVAISTCNLYQRLLEERAKN